MSIRFKGIHHHPKAPVRHNRPLQRSLGLKADDDFVIAIDVAGGVRGDGTGRLRDIEYPFSALLHKECVQMIPDLPGARRFRPEKRLISLVRFVVLLDEVTNVDLRLPKPRLESVPR